MKRTNVKIFCEYKLELLEDEVNEFLSNGIKVIDIKFNITNESSQSYDLKLFNAMIIYETESTNINGS